MNKSFSERYGFKPVKDSFQIEDMDIELRNRLWNLTLKELLGLPLEKLLSTKAQNNINKLYDGFLKENITSQNRVLSFFLKGYFTERFNKLTWYELYDLLEFLNNHIVDDKYLYINNVNQILEQEMSAYRLIDGYITPIISDIEIKSIEDAINSESSGAKQHLKKALNLLSNRKAPDYANSIKESISAVESIVNEIVGTKNQALNRVIHRIPFITNNQFRSGIKNLYEWTSSSDGIRHGVKKDETIESSFEEAKFMLVSCSAFINYLIDKQKSSKS
jgi:hypothetical protein